MRTVLGQAASAARHYTPLDRRGRGAAALAGRGGRADGRGPSRARTCSWPWPRPSRTPPRTPGGADRLARLADRGRRPDGSRDRPGAALVLRAEPGPAGASRRGRHRRRGRPRQHRSPEPSRRPRRRRPGRPPRRRPRPGGWRRGRRRAQRDPAGDHLAFWQRGQDDVLAAVRREVPRGRRRRSPAGEGDGRRRGTRCGRTCCATCSRCPRSSAPFIERLDTWLAGGPPGRLGPPADRGGRDNAAARVALPGSLSASDSLRAFGPLSSLALVVGDERTRCKPRGSDDPVRACKVSRVMRRLAELLDPADESADHVAGQEREVMVATASRHAVSSRNCRVPLPVMISSAWSGRVAEHQHRLRGSVEVRCAGVPGRGRGSLLRRTRRRPRSPGR